MKRDMQIEMSLCRRCEKEYSRESRVNDGHVYQGTCQAENPDGVAVPYGFIRLSEWGIVSLEMRNRD